jgi:shikimate dehydrogenase
VRSSDGLINATPLGMYQYPGNAFNENDIKNQSWSFDAVYTPENTEFMKVCRKLNMQTLSGFQLFLHQGLDAFFHFTGIKTNSDEIEDIFLKKFPDTLI